MRSPADSRRTDRGSLSGRRTAARLAAVQALYQIAVAGASARAVLGEFLEHRLDADEDGGRHEELDRELFRDLVLGIAGEAEELDDMLTAVLVEDWPVERLEWVLRVILRAGAFELGSRQDVPARVIITEYVHVAQGFFGGKEPGLVNGVLDRLARVLRAEEFDESPESLILS